jgi:hypothetical protein
MGSFENVERSKPRAPTGLLASKKEFAVQGLDSPRTKQQLAELGGLEMDSRVPGRFGQPPPETRARTVFRFIRNNLDCDFRIPCETPAMKRLLRNKRELGRLDGRSFSLKGKGVEYDIYL